MILFILVILMVLIAFECSFISFPIQSREENNALESIESYERQKLKTLTVEQIKEIHAKGMLTPAEKVKEWESLDLCAPGDAIGSASSRCKAFHNNCHDCLIDYANQKDEHESILNNLKIVNKL